MSTVRTIKTDVLFLRERASSYVQLVKLRLSVFVVISAVLGYLIGAEVYNLTRMVWLVLGGFFVTASANAFNQIIERDYDMLMRRTQKRPLPLGKVNMKESIIFASFLGVFGIMTLAFLNPLSAVLGVLAIFIYVAIYTPLKRISTYSVFTGAFPGAIPPMLGWVAATGSFSLEAGILFAIQFLWQFPHFWAIAWKIDKDYKKAGFKMLPYEKKSKTTALIICISSLLLFGASFLPEFYKMTGRIATITLCLLSFMMVLPSIQLVRKMEDKYALRIMAMSYIYLIGSLLVIFIDRI